MEKKSSLLDKVTNCHCQKNSCNSARKPDMENAITQYSRAYCHIAVYKLFTFSSILAFAITVHCHTDYYMLV